MTAHATQLNRSGERDPKTTPTLRQSAQPRYHGLDGLRAAMMLLGLFLHAVVSYMHTPVTDGVWPFRDASTHAIWTHTLFFIHIFRMPVFYVMAGFFAVLLLERRGTLRMVWNRTTRILIPFVVGWFVLVPLTFSGFAFANAAQGAGLSEGWSVVRSIPLAKLFVFETIHLWFLYYLMMLYASGIILGAAVHRLPLSWRESGLELFGRLVASRFRAVWFALPTAAILAAMPMGLLKTSTSFIPDPLTLVGYGAFFGFGWLLYLRRDLLVSFNRDAWPCVMLALALSPINLAAAERSTFKMPETDPAAVWVAAGTGALIVWLLVFGLTGLFQRYLNRPIPAVRYVVDASYWVYLIHLPFTIWIPGLLAGVAWPSTLKIATVLAIGTVTWWLSYDLLVRNTFIGVVLNGRRYPRGLPAKATPDLPAKGLQHGATGAFAGRPEPSFASATGDPMRRENEN